MNSSDAGAPRDKLKNLEETFRTSMADLRKRKQKVFIEFRTRLAEKKIEELKKHLGMPGN